MSKATHLTAALEDYLEAIFNLCRFDSAARSRDIAEALNVHKSTVTAALKALGQLDLVNYAPYEAVTLTPEGKRMAEDVVRRHTALKDFFINVLKVDGEIAEKAACGMEHAVPREIVDKLASFAMQMRGCPRLEDAPGRNAPLVTCRKTITATMADISIPEQMTLNSVPVGETVQIVLVRGGIQIKKRIADMGLLRNTSVTVEEMLSADNPMTIIVDNKRMTLPKEDAVRIVVEKSV